ncbi:MAG: hypothetical protein LBD01_02320, partial [Puniceicoccales bacterium]|nr:hypothetical protein [Puniceicoccales bacterium]
MKPVRLLPLVALCAVFFSSCASSPNAPEAALSAPVNTASTEQKTEAKQATKKSADKKAVKKTKAKDVSEPVLLSRANHGRHKAFKNLAQKGGFDVMFIGDSITEGWEKKGRAAWTEKLAPLNAANFGISGDRTGHVLWRLKNGELEGKI